MGTMIKRGGIGLLVAMLAMPVAAESNRIHVYRQENGSKLYTDQQPARSKMTYLGQYGREPATASCAGWTGQRLEERGNFYQDLVTQHAQRFSVDAALVRAVMRVESCFDRRAVSRAGARGLMQLMPGTAVELGVIDSFDADQNIGGGVRYLQAMLARFGNDLSLALAAYNAGPGHVERYRGIPPFPQTQNYVKRVLKEYARLQPS